MNILYDKFACNMYCVRIVAANGLMHWSATIANYSLLYSQIFKSLLGWFIMRIDTLNPVTDVFILSYGNILWIHILR